LRQTHQLLANKPTGNRNRDIAVAATAKADNGAYAPFTPELYLDLACTWLKERSTSG
jgi:hypothetical protein